MFALKLKGDDTPQGISEHPQRSPKEGESVGIPDAIGDGVSGMVKPGFEPVRDAFVANFSKGADIGASAAVFIDGEPVVDLWGGHFDATYTRPWERDTIVQGFSSTKTMTALCALILADRGEIDLNAPVKKYWPEFGAAGKDR